MHTNHVPFEDQPTEEVRRTLFDAHDLLGLDHTLVTEPVDDIELFDFSEPEEQRSLLARWAQALFG